MYTAEEFVAALIAANLAEEYVIETRAVISGNSTSDHSKIIENTKEHVYLPWKESWDAENETDLKYEEFENRSIGGNPTFVIETISSANQSLQKIRINRLIKPIANNISVRFTNSSGSSLWAKHVWKGVKMKRNVYNKYMIPYINSMLTEMGIPNQPGV